MERETPEIAAAPAKSHVPRKGEQNQNKVDCRAASGTAIDGSQDGKQNKTAKG